MWQASPCGQHRRAYFDPVSLQGDIGPHITLLKLDEEYVERGKNNVLWRTSHGQTTSLIKFCTPIPPLTHNPTLH